MDTTTQVCMEFTIPGWILFIVSEILALSDCKYNSIVDVLKFVAAGVAFMRSAKTDADKIIESDDEQSPTLTKRASLEPIITTHRAYTSDIVASPSAQDRHLFSRSQ
jgi:hypothetical protein